MSDAEMYWRGNSTLGYRALAYPEIDDNDDLVRYMVYGTGCNNKSEFFKEEKEMKAHLKKVAKDNSWTGRVVGYKLTPLYEGEVKTVCKVFKTTKVKKVTKRGKRK